MQFSLGIIEFFGILVPGALFAGNILLVLVALHKLKYLDASVLASVASTQTLQALWLLGVSFVAGMCLRMIRPKWAEKGKHSLFGEVLDEWFGWWSDRKLENERELTPKETEDLMNWDEQQNDLKRKYAFTACNAAQSCESSD